MKEFFRICAVCILFLILMLISISLSMPKLIENKKETENDIVEASTEEEINEVKIKYVKPTKSYIAEEEKKKGLNMLNREEGEYIPTKYVVHLGDKPNINKATPTDAKKEEPKQETTNKSQYTLSQFRSLGVIFYGGYRFTYYSETVLSGSGLKIPNRHVDSEGFVCDGDGYICVASCDFPKGTVVDTPFGRYGKVYDYCGVSGTIDIYIH